MELDPKRLTAIFFISGNRGKASLMHLLQQAGATQISLSDDGTEMADCFWATWSCKGYISDLPNHKSLHIYFWQSDFLENLDDVVKPVEQDSLSNLIEAFESACNILLPEAALIATHVWQVSLDLIHRYELMISVRDIEALLKEHFGLLYLENKASTNAVTSLDDRDILKTGSGLMIFAGDGSSRWF